MDQQTSASGADRESSAPTVQAPEPAPLIFPHQQKAFDQLCELTQIAAYTQRQCFPIRPRTNALVVGPTGSGKSTIPQLVGRHLDMPCIIVSVSEWVLLGCSARGAAVTWPAIVEFLSKNRARDGVIIAIDEIDKLSRNTSWETFQLTEIFSLLDLRIPENVRDCDEDEAFSSGTLDAAREVLTTRTMLVGMGAFQQIWDQREASTIGFTRAASDPDMPALKSLAEAIPPELANRFRSDLIILPPLAEGDYHTMLERCADGIPSNFRERFRIMGLEAIPIAVRNRKGPRFLEELLVDLLIAERKEVRLLLDHSKSFKESPEELSIN